MNALSRYLHEMREASRKVLCFVPIGWPLPFWGLHLTFWKESISQKYAEFEVS